MKNPFVKEDHTVLIAIVAASAAITAGAITYLYLTESGIALRNKLLGKAKEELKDAAAAQLSKKTNIPKKAVKKATDIAL